MATIIVIDDDDASELVRFLKENGHEVTQYFSAESAIASVKAADAFIVDGAMPGGMSGMEAIKMHLRKKFGRAKFIGRSTYQWMQESFDDAGADGFVTKSAPFAEILDLLVRLL